MKRRPLLAFSLVATTIFLAAVVGCSKDPPPEPLPNPARVKSNESTGELALSTKTTRSPVRPRHKVNARPLASVTPSQDDPLAGRWTLADALHDLKGTGALLADLELEIPSKGSQEAKKLGNKLTCELFEDKAPLTVANFVGLARGQRPWKSPDNKWVKKPAYDGTLFHRIIRGFMIQGGDAQGTGTGEPGYVIPDEIWEDAFHDRAGLLCMANRGRDTNGAQFFITDAAAPHLDNGYTIFGECAPLDLVHRLAAVEVKGERPSTPPKIKKVTIRRGVSPLAPASASATGTTPTP